MSIQSQCETCGVLLDVPAEFAGKMARCPQCDTVYEVPLQSESPKTPISEDSAQIAQDQDNSDASDAPAQLRESTTQSSSNSDSWYLRTPEGVTYGPVPQQSLDAWTSEGRVTERCLLSTDKETWQSAAYIYPVLAKPISNQGNPFADGPTRAVRSPRLPHRGHIVFSLGIFGLLVCPLLSLMAWFMANGDLREMQMGRMDPSGHGMTKAGYLLGLIFSIAWGLLFLCYFVYAILHL